MLLVILNSLITITLYSVYTNKKGPCSIAFSNFQGLTAIALIWLKTEIINEEEEIESNVK